MRRLRPSFVHFAPFISPTHSQLGLPRSLCLRPLTAIKRRSQQYIPLRSCTTPARTFAAMATSPSPWWDQLNVAISESKTDKTHSYAQLSTIRGPRSGHLSGRPAVRTVNIRSVSDRQLYFVSDLRSHKADDITDGPSSFAELAWYFPRCNKQFRLSGALMLRSGDELARKVWADLYDGQRKWWAWPAPAEKRGSESDFRAPIPENPPDHFCVCVLVPDHVDLVDLSVVPYMREMHDLPEGSRKSNWEIELVNP